ncbi:hypothetical protein [Merismopedia glauca]|uniref:hypothetical protein n=1 Tax=Merismopedia glauca TaxID=292586 RepID=UPI0015E73C0D|nr:hypothetical protein [Merismopedia glauca]
MREASLLEIARSQPIVRSCEDEDLGEVLTASLNFPSSKILVKTYYQPNQAAISHD